MDKNKIIGAVEPLLAQMGCFLVEVTVSAENDIEIVLEKEEGEVTWDDCARVDALMHETFDQDVEDYALTVSSAGLDRPFKVLRQFRKAIGTQVDVRLKGGRRLKAELLDADESALTLRYTALEAVEGKKKKVRVEHTETLPMETVNSVIPCIEFK